MTKPMAPKAIRGIPLIPLMCLYAIASLAPLGLSAALGLPSRPFRDELASALAMTGFAMLLLEFVLSGRFRIISGRLGIDVTMRFHQLIAWTLLVFLLAHPFVYQTSWITFRSGWGNDGLGLTGSSLLSGALALLLLLALVAIAVFRDQGTGDYEGWRTVHGLGAVAIAILGAHHTLDAGRYSEHPVLAGYWLGMLGIALFSVGYVHVITPLRQLRRPYRVTSIKPAALKTWEIIVEPVGVPALEFDAGQFVWLTLDRSPFSITEHPFSMSSCPADRPRIAFTIKEAGDFTNRIGRLPVGARAYLDGPHGNFTMAGREGTGLAFVAGGVGFAPVMSILRQLRAERDPRPMILFYGNRVHEQILYGNEIETMQRDLRLTVHHVLSEPPPGWSGDVGQLDEAMLRRRLDVEDRGRWLYFVCGPTPMIDSVEGALGRLGVPLRQIVSEKFRYE
ncbi:MAG: ferredoxin reductase family protein [Bradyrhizobium sp.]|nr:ferredoxin reductase family protein [Bradyrhizobium sp.]